MVPCSPSIAPSPSNNTFYYEHMPATFITGNETMKCYIAKLINLSRFKHIKFADIQLTQVVLRVSH